MKKPFYIINLLLLFLASCGGSSSGVSGDGILPGEHRIFVTSSSYLGDFGGVSQGDSICDNAAKSVGLKLNYRAILSDSSSSAINSILLLGKVYIFDTSGQKSLVAQEGSDIWDSNNIPLLSAINKDQTGNIASGDVWTGTNDSGNSDGDDCSDWINNGSSGRYGEVGASNFGQWLEKGSKSCSFSARLYCISL